MSIAWCEGGRILRKQRKDRLLCAPPPPAGIGTAFLSPDGPQVTPPPTTNMTLWLNGRAGLPGSGNVASWVDQSGNGNNFTQGTTALQPVIGAINGKTAVAFTAASSQTLTQSTAAALISTTGFTIFSVWKYTGAVSWTPPTSATASIPCILDLGTGSDTLANFVVAAKNTSTPTIVSLATACQVSPFTPIVASVSSHLVANPHQSYHAYNDADVFCGIDTTTPVLAALTGALTDVGGSGARLGTGHTSTTQYWNGLIGELIVYNAFLGSTEVAQIQAYLAAKWGTLGP